jgi:hypothetical protein
MNFAKSLEPIMARGFLFLLVVSCSDSRLQKYMSVDSTVLGQNAILAINQPIVITFDEKLQRPVRSSAVSVVDADGRTVVGYEVVVIANTLQIFGTLPTTASLDNSTFSPGERYVVTLRGLPSVSALRSEQASFLRKDVQLHVSFLELEADGVLSAFDANVKPLFINNLSPNYAINVAEKKKLHFNCDGAIDPRSLTPAKLFVGKKGNTPIACELRLVSNRQFSSTIEVELPSFSGTAYLVLPETIEGISTRRLAKEMTRFQLVGNN